MKTGSYLIYYDKNHTFRLHLKLRLSHSRSNLAVMKACSWNRERESMVAHCRIPLTILCFCMIRAIEAYSVYTLQKNCEKGSYRNQTRTVSRTECSDHIDKQKSVFF